MSGRVHTIITLASALLQLSSAKPADPTITTAAVLPRANKDTFIGYIELNNTWSSLDCMFSAPQLFALLMPSGNSGLTWYQSGQYAQCCPASQTHCYAPTACVGGSQIYTYPDISSVRTIACTENYENTALSICNTILIFENTQDSNPRTDINCGDTSAMWSYYRDLPSEATATTSSTVQSDLLPASSIPGAISSAPVGPTQASEPEPSSKAWIAGAVVGPSLGLALVGAGVWFFLRRKKKAAQISQRGSASMVPIDPNQPPAGVGGYTDAKPQFLPAQPTYYNQPGQPDLYAQQGYPQQGGFSPAHQYGFQSPYNATADPQSGANTHATKLEGIGGTAELDGDDNRIAGILPSTLDSPPGAVSVPELSGVDANRPGEGFADGNKPR